MVLHPSTCHYNYNDPQLSDARTNMSRKLPEWEASIPNGVKWGPSLTPITLASPCTPLLEQVPDFLTPPSGIEPGYATYRTFYADKNFLQRNAQKMSLATGSSEGSSFEIGEWVGL